MDCIIIKPLLQQDLHIKHNCSLKIKVANISMPNCAECTCAHFIMPLFHRPQNLSVNIDEESSVLTYANYLAYIFIYANGIGQVRFQNIIRSWCANELSGKRKS